ncbi:MAG: ABC transporter ATP-binding protein [Magnetococcales bacterium]|nr:ABC transporter ATP-binding protein [Magnetococcales bacterium]
MTLEEVVFAWPGGGDPLLDGVSLTLNQGQRLAILGEEGSGKSTLMGVMAGLLAVESGQILLMGEPLILVPQRERVRRLGLLFGDPTRQFLTPRVGEEVALGPASLGLSGENLHQRVADSLTLAGLGGGDIKRSLAGLSAAEGARVAWAAVMANHPRLLLLDEPGGWLSERGEGQMAARLGDYVAAKAGGLIAFTSRPQRAKLFAEEIYRLEGGRLSPFS